MIGERFGRLVVIALGASGSRTTKKKWICACDCGGRTITNTYSLRAGKTRSCGCYQIELSTKHGQSGIRSSPTYRSWKSMRVRCSNQKIPAYKNYGGRGIAVCQRWDSFIAFLADMGERPEGTTLDRRNNDGDYDPDNCRWATKSEQAKNRRNARRISFQGATLSLSDWDSKIRASVGTIRHRLKNGWSIEKAITTPVRTLTMKNRPKASA